MELKPGGADIVVTRENRVEYIFLVSHYRTRPQLEPEPLPQLARGLDLP